MSDDDATGNFGPITQQGLRDHPLGSGSSGTWVGFFRTGMLMNRRSGVTFATDFDNTLAGQVETFQGFCALSVNGTADYPTWASLLVSYGDTSRVGKGADCSTQLVAADLTALKSRGVSVVGRYLSTVPGSTFQKQLGDDEPGDFHDAGVSIFPVFETSGDYLDYFTAAQGRFDALSALGWLDYYGFASGTIVYFAVDYDMMEEQVTSNVIPYFQSIASVFGSHQNTYRIGAYGARHVCQMLADNALSTSSYVLDMSSGYSGNLGYPLPDNWAFDQISGFSLSAGGRSVDYDNVIVSGRDTGQGTFTPNHTARQDVEFSGDWDALHTSLLATVKTLTDATGVNEGYAEYKKSTASNPLLYYTHSLTDAVNKLKQYDQLITQWAQKMSIRKALIQVEILWEYYGIQEQDFVEDKAIYVWISAHMVGAIPDVSYLGMVQTSTGMSQIFPSTALDAITWADPVYGLTLASGSQTNQGTINAEWLLLQSETYDVVCTAAVITRAANKDSGYWDPGSNGKIGLTASDPWTLHALTRWAGTGSGADATARDSKSMYDVLESYNKIARGY